MDGERVLVVDDDAGLRSLLALICRRAGFDVDTATDGAQALQLIEQHQYLLVTLDLQMPKMNGFDVIREVRTRRPRPSILVLTALPPNAYAGLDAGVVQAIIRKPFDVELLTSILADLALSARQERQQTEGDEDSNVVDFRRQ